MDNEETVKTASKQGKFEKGDPRINRNGRPKGSLSFSTKWERMIEKIAMQDNLTPDEVELELIKVGYKKAKDGDYSFYRDAMDRIHGKPKESIDHNVQGGVVFNFDPAFKSKLDDITLPTEEDSSI